MKSADALKNDSVLIVAAEASSCMYAKNLLKNWWSKNSDTQFFGVGDKEMAQMGVECSGYAEDMAVVGLQEVIKHYSDIKAVADELLKKVDEYKPRFALLLDYPGFNLRLAKKLKEKNIPVVYYISPQLWAWKKGRVKQVKAYVDDMLVVFPFEVDFYKEHNVEAHFVGHPLVEVIEQEKGEESKENETLVLGLMPGSRHSEIQYNLRNQMQAAEILHRQLGVKIKVLLAPTLDEADVKEKLQNFKVPFELVKAGPTAMIESCDYIISASGTATLQVALCEKPMVVMYRMNSVTAFLAKRLVNTVDAFCIVNIIAGKKVIPELFQEEASPKKLASAMATLITDEKARSEMLTELRKIKTQLGKEGATENVVQFLKGKYY